MGSKKHRSKKPKAIKVTKVIAQKRTRCKTICKFLFVPLLMAVLCFFDFHTYDVDSWYTSAISFQSCEYANSVKHHYYILQDTSGQQYRIKTNWFGTAEQQQLLTDVSVGDTLYIRWHRTLYPNRKFVDTLESDNIVYRSLNEAKQKKGYVSLLGGIFFSLIVLAGCCFLYGNLKDIHRLKQCKQEFILEHKPQDM